AQHRGRGRQRSRHRVSRRDSDAADLYDGPFRVHRPSACGVLDGDRGAGAAAARLRHRRRHAAVPDLQSRDDTRIRATVPAGGESRRAEPGRPGSSALIAAMATLLSPRGGSRALCSNPAQLVGLIAAGQIVAWTLVPALTHLAPPLDVVEGYM